MKLLFFSSDRAEVEQVREAFAQAKIACEVSSQSLESGTVEDFRETELWITDDLDWHRAALLCVELGIGLARPAAVPETSAG